MKNILVCNQKGGVGKSLIADELAFSFERSRIPVSFFDLDSQGGTIHQTAQHEDAEVSVIDTPGALQSAMGDWIAGADVIVIPTRTTSRDIQPLQRMLRLAQGRRAETPVVCVLNAWNRWRASRDFLAWLQAQTSDCVILTLPQAEQFVQAAAAGMSVVDFARRGAAVKATLELCNTVREMAGFPAE